MFARTATYLIAAAALSAPATASAAPRLEKVGDFQQPVHVTGAPGDFERLYVVEQRGRIHAVRGGQAREFVNLSSLVRSYEDAGGGGEEGLLSVAFAPDFAQSRRLYVYYTDNDSNNRVEELRAPSNDVADPASRRPVIVIEHPGASNHNGGQLQFGPDGMLYLAPGDGGSNPFEAASLNSELGKILRIDPRQAGPFPYRIPPDNPFYNQPGRRGEIWSYGLRNPFRFSFDRKTGDLTVGDVGESTTEEIDFVPASQGAGRGVNFGWNACEGSYATGSTTTPCPTPGAVSPVINAFQVPDGWRSIINGYVVHDPTLPSLLGRFVYSDAAKGQLWSARLAQPSALDVGYTGLAIPGASSFGEDAAGCLYVTQLGGQVSRIVENDDSVPCPGAAPGPSLLADSTAPTLRTRVKRRQRVLRLGGAVAYARCSEACSVAAGGQLRIGRRSYAMRRVLSLSAQADARKRLSVRLTSRGRRALRAALRRGRKASVALNLRARDGVGNRSPLARRGVRVKR